MASSTHRSLVGRFNTALAVVYVLSILTTAPALYLYIHQRVYDEARHDLALLVDAVKSVQKLVSADLRPHLLERGIFLSPAVSSTAATLRFGVHFGERQPEFFIRVASDNPLNPKNRAEGLEAQLLARFRANRGTSHIDEAGVLAGRRYLVNAVPRVADLSCQKCHGKPADAPEDITKAYGTESGYGYRLDEVVGVSMVAVPLASIEQAAVQRGLIVIGGLTTLFGLLFVVLNVLVRRLVLRPIADITLAAKAVSGGDINKPMTVDGTGSEIVDLASSFELMRRSLVTAMKRLQKRT